MLHEPFALVDLETSGTHPVRDRIIEIGIVRVRDGQIEDEWSALVDPGVPLSPLINTLTGIDAAMLQGAPSFGALADEVQARLAGSLFVAHNARFDHGFLSNEFKRLERPFQPRVLCTVQLSRALYPEHRHHGLDALIARHQLCCAARHRALDDARVLWEFLRCASAEKPAAAIDAALKKIIKDPARTAHR